MSTVKQYLRNVRSSFPVFRKNERRFFDEFKLAVGEYESLYPECSMNDLDKRFGTPKDIVEVLLSINQTISRRDINEIKIIKRLNLSISIYTCGDCGSPC